MSSFTRPGSSVIDYNAVTGDSVTTAAQKVDIALNDLYTNIVDGTASVKGIVQLGTTATTAALGNHLHTGTYALSGANSDITSLSGLTTPLSVAQGGTGGTTALGTAATKDTGTGSTQVPLNSNLGTASVLNVGTSANNILQLNSSAKIPAVDASLVTGLSALAKLTLAENKVIYIDSSGVPQQLTLGAAGTVLTSAGATSAPTFTASSGGEWEYVSKNTDAAAAAKAFTGLVPATYDYKLVFRGCSLSANGYMMVQMGTGETPTYVTSSYASSTLKHTGAGVTSSQVASTGCPICDSLTDKTAESLNGESIFYVFGSYVGFSAQTTVFDGAHIGTFNTGGTVNGQTTFTALRMLANSGNVSGTIELWRREKK